MKFVISSRFDGVEPKLSRNDVRFGDGVMRWQVVLDADSEQFIYASAEELRALAQRFWELADEANRMDLQRLSVADDMAQNGSEHGSGTGVESDRRSLAEKYPPFRIADYIDLDDAADEICRLRDEIEALRAEVQALRTVTP